MNNFLCVKSLVTIAIVITFCILVITNPITYAETFKNAFFTIVSFYFGTQFQKGKDDKK